MPARATGKGFVTGDENESMSSVEWFKRRHYSRYASEANKGDALPFTRCGYPLEYHRWRNSRSYHDFGDVGLKDSNYENLSGSAW